MNIENNQFTSTTLKFFWTQGMNLAALNGVGGIKHNQH